MAGKRDKVEDLTKILTEDVENITPVPITQEMIDEQALNSAKKEMLTGLEDISSLMDTKLEEEKSKAESDDKGIYEDDVVENTTYQASTEKRVTNPTEKDTYKEVDQNDLMPGYDDGDEEQEEKKEDKAKEVDPNSFDFTSLPEIKIESNPEAEEIFVKKTKNIRIVQTKNPNLKNVGDQAFINSVNRYRKDVGKTMTMPLINSGFKADMIGGGILDLILLYSGNRDKNEIDYELDKMKTIMKSVVGTTPSIRGDKLSSAIHYIDYQMMAFGYVCGTLNEVVIPHTCTNEKCIADFKITSNPIDMILNLDEISNKIAALNSATIDNYYENSLLGYIQNIIFEDGIKVTLGHPSYLDMVNLLNNLKYISSKDANEGAKYATLLSLISFIRHVILPGGEMTVNGYQIYKTLSLLDEEEFKVLKDAIKVENDKIIQPKFGIKSVKCPVCDTDNTDIQLQNLDELVFFHIMATQQAK